MFAPVWRGEDGIGMGRKSLDEKCEDILSLNNIKGKEGGGDPNESCQNFLVLFCLERPT